MKFIIGLLASFAVTTAIAQQVPNLVGTWVGETNDALIGAGRHYPGGKAGEIRFVKEKVTYKFDRQEKMVFTHLR
jgi:hypothetical protein